MDFDLLDHVWKFYAENRGIYPVVYVIGESQTHETTGDVVRSVLSVFEKENDLFYWPDYEEKSGDFEITDTGRDLWNKLGSFEKYLAYKEEQKRHQEKLQKAKDQKVFFDTKLAKWQTRIFWPIFIFAFVGFGNVIYTVYDKVTAPKQEEVEKRIVKAVLYSLEKRKPKLKTQIKPYLEDSISRSKPLQPK